MWYQSCNFHIIHHFRLKARKNFVGLFFDDPNIGPEEFQEAVEAYGDLDRLNKIRRDNTYMMPVNF